MKTTRLVEGPDVDFLQYCLGVEGEHPVCPGDLVEFAPATAGAGGGVMLRVYDVRNDQLAIASLTIEDIKLLIEGLEAVLDDALPAGPSALLEAYERRMKATAEATHTLEDWVQEALKKLEVYSEEDPA
jgi:hypothetical protein